MAGWPARAGTTKTTIGTASSTSTARPSAVPPATRHHWPPSPAAAPRRRATRRPQAAWPAKPKAVASKASASKGPTAASVRGAATSRLAAWWTSSQIDRLDPGQHLVDGAHLAVQQEGGAEPAHPGARVLAGQQRLGPQVPLGHGQLPVGDPVVGQQLELPGDDAQHLVDVTRGRCRP